MSAEKRHKCQTCGAPHFYPKAGRVTRTVVFAILFAIVEVLAALRLDGWVAVALWVIVAWNAGLVLLLVHGLSRIAAGESS